MPRLELTARFSPLACTGLVVLATVGMSNAAIIIPISQVRSVNAGASGSFTPVNQTITATGFGPFDAVASVSTGVTDNGQISLSASQHSSIFSNFISCNGELRIVDLPDFPVPV
ncbi:MAG TPA: hypothetical protein PKE29_06215 [Phycisphaerales bacterium]|nr:hypothetical protein [Phycisphaerales bacterium]